MTKTFIFGHKNPDTDAISSALIMADFEQQTGNTEAKAYRLGEISAETQFALDYFNVEAPELLNEDLKGQDVILVDHNEFQQSADTISNATIKHVIDHHRISNFETAGPLYYRAEPVGCSATILYKMYKERGFEIKPEIAGLMISAIISDSLLFKSPTCTKEDVDAAQALKDIANVDLEAYGLEMLKAGTNLGNKSEDDLIDLDAKSFPMGGANLRIAQVNVVDPEELLARRDALEESMRVANDKNGYDTFVFVITNILTSVSTVLVVGDHLDKVAQAFNASYTDGVLTLPGVVSRKKQVVPPLTVAFEG